MSLARASGNPGTAIAAHHFVGTMRFWMADLPGAREQFQAVLQIADTHSSAGATVYTGHDPAVSTRCHMGLLSWLTGYPERARDYTDAAVRQTQGGGAAPTTVVGGSVACWTYVMRGDVRRVADLAASALTQARAGGFAMWEAIAGMMLGWAQGEQGIEGGLEQLCAAFAAHQTTGAAGSADFCTLVAAAHLRAGDPVSGLRVIDEGFETLARCQQRYIEPELHRLKGELLLQANGSHDAVRAAAACFRQAITVAKEHGSKSLELRAATSFARMPHRNRTRAEARALLAGVYEQFTEGHATRDLQAARALLAE